MVKLDLNISEIVGLAELGKIDKNKLKKFLKTSNKDELEDYIIEIALGNEEVEESNEEDNVESTSQTEEIEEDADL